jgi:hypothetical protein
MTGLLVLPLISRAQYPFPAPTTPDAQRNALTQVRSQVNWLQNATRTASNYSGQGHGIVWERFQIVRGAYAAFKQTLNPRQLADGGNSFAELDGGLDILQEAFENYQTDLAAGRPPGPALRDMCQVLRDGSRLWLEELNKTCSRLRVGWH